METVTEFLRNYWEGFLQRDGGGMSDITYDHGHEYCEKMGERSIF